MCFCESDAVNVLIHVRARQRYPGIKFHEPSLAIIAKRFGIRSTLELRAMSDTRLAELTAALVNELPADARPARDAVPLAIA